MPLIVVLMLIYIIVVCIVGASISRPQKIAELNKVEEKEEWVSAAVDIAATTIGTNVKATFTVSTGEIYIYNSSTSKATATINSSWNTFLGKITKEDSNLDAVKTITFADEIYAPANSSNLFYPLISKVNYPFNNLVAINNINSLNTSKVTDMSNMFYGCKSLTSLDVSNWDTSKVTNMSNMFYECRSLTELDVTGLEFGNVTNAEYLFANCYNLKRLIDGPTGDVQLVNMHCLETLFSGCNNLEEVTLSRLKAPCMASMFQEKDKLRRVTFARCAFSRMRKD